MNAHLKKTVTSSLFLKVVALIIGFRFWVTLSDSFTRSQWLKVPLCFYNKHNQQIRCPETVWVELRGKRSHLRHINSKDIAIHIDADSLANGPNQTEITGDLLLLPDSINVVDTIPHNIVINVTGAS